MSWFNYYCPTCAKGRRYLVRYSYVNEKVDSEIPTEYTLADCNACGYPGLFIREDEGFGWRRDSYFQLWPGDGRDSEFIVPYSVHREYLKCKVLEKEGASEHLVLQIGKTLEAICQNLAPNVKGLGKALNQLKADNVITGDIYEWANELRVMRNESAHPSGVEFTRREAKECFDFLEEIIKVVYWMKGQFKIFKDSRERANKAE